MNPMKRHISTLLLILLTLVTAQSRTDADSEIVESPTFLIPKDITKDVNYGYREAKRSAADIDVIVIHSCYYAQADSFSTDGCISQFRQHNVSPHYIISRSGEIIKMVEEHNIAQHAGRSMLPGVGRTHLNDSSIGIEIVNTRTEGPNYIQYNALCPEPTGEGHLHAQSHPLHCGAQRYRTYTQGRPVVLRLATLCQPHPSKHGLH